MSITVHQQYQKMLTPSRTDGCEVHMVSLSTSFVYLTRHSILNIVAMERS